jgi:ABC-type Fe3+-hydroxamate transport system, periplasmic component
MRSVRLLTALSAAVLVVAGCAGQTETTSAVGDAAGGFPVTIRHAFGETVIPAKPERVATVAWANHEVPLALGIVPVGFPAATWGDDDGDGVLPWVEERLEELGAETPVLFDETDSIDFEAVADTNPDVILAAYSGLTQEEYDTLSQIAPVVAYPDVAWSTSLQDMIRLNSRALGLAEEGERLIAELEKQISDSLARYPQLTGKSAMFSWFDLNDLSQVGFYTTHDTRPGFLASIGFATPAIVAERSAASEAFFDTVSAEQADLFADVDIIVAYDTPDGAGLAAAQAHPLLSRIPAIARGSVVLLENGTPLAASANPSPLSVGWGIEEYVALLAAAADKVDRAGSAGGAGEAGAGE